MGFASSGANRWLRKKLGEAWGGNFSGFEKWLGGWKILL